MTVADVLVLKVCAEFYRTESKWNAMSSFPRNVSRFFSVGGNHAPRRAVEQMTVREVAWRASTNGVAGSQVVSLSTRRQMALVDRNDFGFAVMMESLHTSRTQRVHCHSAIMSASGLPSLQQ